jgi:hypothetical protein
MTDTRAGNTYAGGRFADLAAVSGVLRSLTSLRFTNEGTFATGAGDAVPPQVQRCFLGERAIRVLAPPPSKFATGFKIAEVSCE